jgi:flagellar motor protein MotB
MARKKKHPEHVNHERWLISYADFITLLFAFFVVMFAVSQVDSKKVGRFTESFSKAIGVDMFPQAGRGILAGATEGTIKLLHTTDNTAQLLEITRLSSVFETFDDESAAIRSFGAPPAPPDGTGGVPRLI